MSNEEMKQDEIVQEEATEETASDVKEAEEDVSNAAQETKAKAEEKAEDAESISPADKRELKKKDEQIKDLTDRYQRTLAEYQNFRNRTEKEKADLYAYAVKDVMTKILPVLDNLKLGLKQIPDDAKDEAFAQGMVQLEKQFEKAMTDIGVEPIEAVGKPFDPDFHNAVMQVEAEDADTDTVVNEFQTGYTYKGSVIRHSMVQVAK